MLGQKSEVKGQKGVRSKVRRVLGQKLEVKGLKGVRSKVRGQKSEGC